jgi:hypothetical protein
VAQPRIVVLSSRTLFAEGVAASLRRGSEEREFRTMDAQQPEVTQQLVAFQPTVVIVDATDQAVKLRCPLDNLLDALPALTLLRLDPQHEHLQVVTSHQRFIRSLNDIVSVIDSLPAEEDNA